MARLRHPSQYEPRITVPPLAQYQSPYRAWGEGEEGSHLLEAPRDLLVGACELAGVEVQTPLDHAAPRLQTC